MTMMSSNSSEACHLSYYEYETHDLSYYKREADEIDWWCKVRERDEYLRGLNEAERAEYDRGWNAYADLLADDGRGDELEDNLGSPHFLRGYRDLEANHDHHRQS